MKIEASQIMAISPTCKPEVAEGLACSRSGLHDEVSLSQEGIHHRSNHLLLPSAQLASAWEMAGDFVQ